MSLDWLWWAVLILVAISLWRQRDWIRAEWAKQSKEKVRKQLLTEVEAMRKERGFPPRPPKPKSNLKPEQPIQLPSPAGVEAVLAGVLIAAPERLEILRVWNAERNGNFDRLCKSVAAVLGDCHWDWPWFDECLMQFRELGEYPDCLGWDVFDPGEPEDEPKTPDDALNWIGIAEARRLLKEFGIKPAGRKHSDVYNALYARVPFERWRDTALDRWRKSEAERLAGPTTQDVARAKIRLLAGNMMAVDYVAHRLEQVNDLVAGGRYVMRIQPADKLALRFMLNPLRSSPHPDLPPYYPGDRTEVLAVRT